MSRGQQNTRFELYYLLYQQNLAKVPNTAEAMKFNVEKSEYFIYENELPKFAEKYPDVNVDDFKAFLTEFGAFKAKATKSGGAGRVGLESVEKAKSLGVSDADAQTISGLMTEVKKYVAEVDKLLASTGYTVGVYFKKPAPVKTAESGSDNQAS